MSLFRSKKILPIIGTTALAAAIFSALQPHFSKKQSAALASATLAKTAAADAKKGVAPLALDFATALRDGRIRAEFKSNGKDKLALTAHNIGVQPLRLRLAAGQLFVSTNDKSTITLLRSREINLAANGHTIEELQTAATASSNSLAACEYSISIATLPMLAPLFSHLEKHPEISAAVAQTCVLALTENLPLSAFAKFPQPTGGIAIGEAKAFKTDTVDIIGALSVLRDLGLDQQLALTIDPQLKIEAMIDPASHADALRYYRIGDEWAYWKHELLEGDGSTRHYALYGIARFFPDVALQMLPKWAREPRTNQVYRVSAVQALAETRRQEALPILRALEQEFGAETELGKTARTAADYLDAQFSKSAKIAVAFRTSSKNTVAQQQPPQMANGKGIVAAAN